MNTTSQATPRSPAAMLAQGAAFGLIFGFLLQKGGVAKYHILMGQLLLEDWTVAKVMFTAITVGGTGAYLLARMRVIKLHLKPTNYAANLVGGLIFGVGFALSGYCPGTGAAAFGQGNFDALAVMFGMMIGSWLYAESSGYLGRTVESHGKRGKLAMDQLLHVPRTIVLLALWIILIGAFLFR